MRLLDLFCGAGGCSAGYRDAGFSEIVGVDNVRQWEYPYEFVLGDALTHPLDGFDVVHASPPCKPFSTIQGINRNREAAKPRLFDRNPDLLRPMLERLRDWGGVWIVENLPGAPMPDDAVTVCGSAFGLQVRRHRLFAASVPLTGSGCDHAGQGQCVGVYGHGGAWSYVAPDGSRRGTKVTGAAAGVALGIDWTTDQRRLSQAIPPAYTEFIGGQVLEAIR